MSQHHWSNIGQAKVDIAQTKRVGCITRFMGMHCWWNSVGRYGIKAVVAGTAPLTVESHMCAIRASSAQQHYLSSVKRTKTEQGSKPAHTVVPERERAGLG